jgi:ribosomal protein S18 acetylase RimI-like enzyme
MDHIAQDVKDWLNNEVCLLSLTRHPSSHQLDLNPNQADVKYYAWFGRWSTSVFGPTGLGDSLYINLVAVRSDQRRKGIGKQLMRAALEQAEKEGVPVTLLSHEESNVRSILSGSSCLAARHVKEPMRDS